MTSPVFTLLVLPYVALQHVLRTMDEIDLITASLCSKTAKNVVTSLRMKAKTFRVRTNNFTVELYPEGRQLWNLKCCIRDVFEESVDQPCRLGANWYPYGSVVWDKDGFGKREWVQHLFVIFNHKTVELTFDENCQDLEIDDLEEALSGLVIEKLSIRKTEQPISYDARLLEVFQPTKTLYLNRNPYTDKDSLHKVLSLELDSMEISFKLNPNDVPVINCSNLTILQADLYPIDVRIFLRNWINGWSPKLESIYMETVQNGPNDTFFILEGIDYQFKDDERAFNQERFGTRSFRKGWYEIKRMDGAIASFNFTRNYWNWQLYLHVLK